MSWVTPRAWLQSFRSAPPQDDAVGLPFRDEGALADPAGAIALIGNEHVRLAERLPDYLDEVREETRNSAAVSASDLHRNTVAALAGMDRFAARLSARPLGPALSLALARRAEHAELLRSLSDAVRELTGVIRQAGPTGPLAGLMGNMAEALHAVLVTAAEVMASPDESNLALLHDLTADRGQVLEAVRGSLLRGEVTLSPDEHHVLFTSTSLFERIIRLLRRSERAWRARASDPSQE